MYIRGRINTFGKKTINLLQVREYFDANYKTTMDNRKNNFDFLRLIFASFVIITHSYPLSGVPECDFLCQLTNGQVSFSYIGLKGFFVISGYLIFQSLQRSENLIEFFWKRLLRLYPALFVVLLLTLLLAPLVYEGNIPFFQNNTVLSYLPNNLSLYLIQPEITGVFGNNTYKHTINGSLWTIPYEFTMYISLGLLIFFRKNEIINKTILILLFVFLLIGNLFYFEKMMQYKYILSIGQLQELGIFFIAGSIIASLKIEKIKRKKEILLILTLFVLISIHFEFYNYTRYVTLPILFILFGLNPISFICEIGNKIGDLSYGIYIYGFLVQQTLMHFFKLNYIELMIYSLIISFILAYFSWHFIEKKAIQFKNILRPLWKKG